MAAALLAMVLSCVRASPHDATFAGPGVELRQTVVGSRVTLTLVERNGKVRWKLEEEHSFGIYNPVFSDNGRYVAARDSGGVRVIGPDGEVEAYEVMALVSEDEQSLFSSTSCGRGWFGGMHFTGETLVVRILQGPYDSPEPAPAIEVSVDVVSGKMSRAKPAMVKTVESLVAEYRSRKEARLEAAKWLARKSSQEAHRKDPALLAFAQEELPKAAEPEVQADLLEVIERAGGRAGREWVAERALKAGWPPESVLKALGPLRSANPEPLRAYARAVFEQHLGGAEVRRLALDELAHAPDASRYVLLALADRDPSVRRAAAHLRRPPEDDATFEFLVAHAEFEEVRSALVMGYVRDHPRWWGRFEKACEAEMLKAWPACEAWSGAMADLRKDTALAKKRYERALEAITPELAQSDLWSSAALGPFSRQEREGAFFRLHHRLALLAKAAHRPQEVAKHVEAIRRSRWWNPHDSDCSNGLPSGMGIDCRYATYGELLMNL